MATVKIDNIDDHKELVISLAKLLHDNRSYTVEVKEEKQRTLSQNAALHVYFDHVAKSLNDAGIEQKNFFKEGCEVPFDSYIVKNYLWKPVQKAMTQKESTTEPNTAEYVRIYEVLNRKLAEHGIYVPWPSNR